MRPRLEAYSIHRHKGDMDRDEWTMRLNGGPCKGSTEAAALSHLSMSIPAKARLTVPLS